jgi:hypothetical protein
MSHVAQVDPRVADAAGTTHTTDADRAFACTEPIY